MTNILTTTQADIVNRMHPDAQKVALGTEIATLGAYAPVIITYAVTADASGAAVQTIPALPFDFEVLDVVVQARVSSGGGTLTLRKASTAITDAMVCTTDKAIVRAGTIDDAQASILSTDTLTVIAAGANDRGLITIFGKRA